jgi:PKD repeat protein
MKRLLSILLVLVISLSIDPGFAVAEPLEFKITAADGAAEDNFGMSVAVSGDTVVVGAPYDDDKGIDSGSVYVFVSNGGSWVQQAKIIPEDGMEHDGFGYSVAIDGDTAVIGATSDLENNGHPGSAYVYVRSGGFWSQEAKLTPDDSMTGDMFGCSVALDGDTAVVGAYGNTGSRGSAYVFVQNGGIWSQQVGLYADDGAADDMFGYSVSIDGSSIMVGAPYDDDSGTDCGSAYAFVNDGFDWVQQAKIISGDGVGGDNFGNSVSINADTAVVGAYGDDGNLGSAYVFVQNGGIWSQQAKLMPAEGVVGDYIGWSVVISEDTAIVTAPFNNTLTGVAYLYEREEGIWSQREILSPTISEPFLLFGLSAAINDDIAVIGSPYDNENGGLSGAAYVFSPDVPAGSSIILEMAAGADDATETAQEKLKTGSELNIRSYPGDAPWQRTSTGLRFQNINVPQGATVVASYISIYPNTTKANDINCNIYVEATGNAEDFIDNPHIVNEAYRPRGIYATAWVEDDLAVGTYVNSPSLNVALQELFDRTDWTSGNSLAVMMIANEDVDKQIRFWHQEKWKNLPVTLYIDYRTDVIRPVADPNGPYTDGVIGEPVIFDGTGSYDPDGIIVDYNWDFGDGSTGTGLTPMHIYAVDGTYTVTLTVTDDDGTTDIATTTATIEPDTYSITLTIAADTDDATETAREKLKTGDELNIRSYPGDTPWERTSTGLRFQDIGVPQGATVIASYISIYPHTTKANDINCNIYIEATGDAENFVDNPHIINEAYRPRGAYATAWVEDDLAVGTYVNGPSLNVALQELFDRPDWTSGNSLTVMMIANEDIDKQIRFWHQKKWYDLPVTLYIEYDLP